jgi:hypothetical protein
VAVVSAHAIGYPATAYKHQLSAAYKPASYAGAYKSEYEQPVEYSLTYGDHTVDYTSGDYNGYQGYPTLSYSTSNYQAPVYNAPIYKASGYHFKHYPSYAASSYTEAQHYQVPAYYASRYEAPRYQAKTYPFYAALSYPSYKDSSYITPKYEVSAYNAPTYSTTTY